MNHVYKLLKRKYFFDSNSRYEKFTQKFPQYENTHKLDELRRLDFARLDDSGHTYLDYTGANLYPKTIVSQHLIYLQRNLLGNPHSTNLTSQRSTTAIDEARSAVLEYFNAGDNYHCIFTGNATAALKIIGESYPFDNQSALILTLDNHNSVNGIREYAKAKGAEFKYSPIDKETLFIDKDQLIENLKSFSGKKNKLFAFPAQSNVSGIQHPLHYIKLAQEKGWDVLLDTAAYVQTNRLDLQEFSPDFAVVSFYKIFGYPTGLGCLLIKKSKFNLLKKPWYAGGTINLSSATYDGHYLAEDYQRFEDGTVNFLSIPALKFGIEYINKIGINNINLRVKALTGWIIDEIRLLSHASGYPLVKIYGSLGLSHRGGTLVFNLFNNKGEMLPFDLIEKAANEQNISLRVGCFCNPGIDETNNYISFNELKNYFEENSKGNYLHMIESLGKLRGGIRISIGMASNFKDAERFIALLRTFVS